MSTEFKISSELLDNYKKFSFVHSEKKMHSVCTKNFKGFLSIGDDGVLYLTYEASGGAYAWTRMKLCDSLRNLHSRAKNLEIKTFAAEHDPVSDMYILTAALFADGKDYLYISQTPDIPLVSWKEIPIEDDIRNLYTMDNLELVSYGGVLVIIAAMKGKNGNIERFYINPDEKIGALWHFYPLPANFDAVSIMCMGRAGRQKVDGMYTLGSNDGSRQLLYTPSYNVYDPEIAPTSVRLNVWKEADSIAVCHVENKPCTHLFACGGGKLCLYPYDGQNDLDDPIEIVSSSFFNDIKQLFAFTSRGNIYVWALNESKQLVYVHTIKDAITDKQSWSPVLEMRDDLSYIYPFWDSSDSTNAMFGYLTDDNGIIGQESPDGIWFFEKIIIEAPAGKPVPVLSHTTKIIVCDETGNTQPGKKVLLKAKEHCAAYVNGVSYHFKDNPVEAAANANGEIKILQKANSPSAVIFHVQESGGVSAEIDSSAHLMEKLFDLDTKEKLKNARIVSQSGSSEPLVPPSADQNTVKITAEAIGTLKKIKTQIDNNENTLFNGIRISFNNGNVSSQSVPYAFGSMNDYLVSYNADVLNAPQDAGFPPFSPGDVFSFLKGIAGKIYSVTVCAIDGAWRFIVETGGVVMSFIIDCAQKVAACIVQVFEWIKVAIEKIIEFLKFIFNMDDIIKTKEVMKKLINICMNEAKDGLRQLKNDASAGIDEIIKAVENFGDLQDIGELGNKTPVQIKNDNAQYQAKDVRSDYFCDLVMDNFHEADRNISQIMSNAEISNSILDDFKELIDYLKNIFDQDKRIIDELIARIQNEFIKDDAIMRMDLQTIFKKLISIISISVLEIGRQIINILIDIAIKAIDLIQEYLNKDIYFPAVTEFLDLIGIPRFSIMDVVCFCTAFMANFVYKLVTQKKLINEEEYNIIMKINTLSDIGKLQLAGTENGALVAGGLDISKYAKSFYSIFKILAGISAWIEAAIHYFNNFDKKTKDSKLQILFGAADGACYFLASLAYLPMKGKIKLMDYSYIFSGFKYSPFFLLMLAATLEARGEIEIAKMLYFGSKCGYAITSALTIIPNIVFLSLGASYPTSVEKTLFNIDYSSLIFDNIRNVLDFILNLESLDPYVRFCVLNGRFMIAGIYNSMQLGIGIASAT